MAVSKTMMFRFGPLLGAMLLLPAGCAASGPAHLMSTPILSTGIEVDPFAHLDSGDQGTETTIFYGTNRIALKDDSPACLCSARP